MPTMSRFEKALERRSLAASVLDQPVAFFDGRRAPGRLVLLQNFGYGVPRVLPGHPAIVVKALFQLMPPLAQFDQSLPSRPGDIALAACALLIFRHGALDQRLARLDDPPWEKLGVPLPVQPNDMGE